MVIARITIRQKGGYMGWPLCQPKCQGNFFGISIDTTVFNYIIKIGCDPDALVNIIDPQIV